MQRMVKVAEASESTPLVFGELQISPVLPTSELHVISLLLRVRKEVWSGSEVTATLTCLA